MLRWLSYRWPDVAGIAFFAVLTAGSLLLSLANPSLATGKFAAMTNAALAIGTGGIVSFLFYYLVNERLERRRRKLLRDGVKATYLDAKRNIALAVIQASQRGGRKDLQANVDTVERCLTPEGFKSLFKGGREADEGFYAFENEMSSQTSEYEEIVFNLKIMGRAAERLADSSVVDDQHTHLVLVRLSTLVDRIERNGSGYDESKLLCGFIWQIFAGWNIIDGDLGHDPIEHAIEGL
ncbi:MAG TPA: hypothetical protein VGG29_20500 [Caulobacteraceae bacterium]